MINTREGAAGDALAAVAVHRGSGGRCQGFWRCHRARMAIYGPETEPFRRAAAVARGVTDRQLRASWFRAVFRGVHVGSAVPDQLGLRCAAFTLLRPAAVFSHRTAAQMLRLPVDDDGDLHVTLPPGSVMPRRPGVRAYESRLTDDDRTEVDDVQVTSAARTFVDLAATLSRTDLIVLGDAILRRRRATAGELAAAVERATRRRGVVPAREALPLLEPRADSPAETRTRLILTDAGFPRPRANVDVFDDHGEWIARGDLVYDEPRVVFEYDGETHLATVEARRHTAARNELMRDLGWEVVVVTALDLRRPAVLIRRAEEAFARAVRRRAA